MSQENEVAKLVPTKPEAEIAAELKARVTALEAQLCEIFDDAAKAGLSIQWDAIAPGPPFFRHGIRGLRVVKTY